MYKQTNQHPHHRRLTILIIVFVVLIIGLISWIFAFKNTQKTKTLNTINFQNNPQRVTPSQNDTHPNISPLIRPKEAPNRNTLSPSSVTQTTQAETQPCFQGTTTVCVIKQNDLLFTYLGDTSREWAFWIGNTLVVPKKIVYQITYGLFSDEQLKDASNKILLSTEKVFDENTKTLTVTVGVDQAYYLALNSQGKHTFTTSQLVRSLLAMTRQSPEDYITTQAIVTKLGNWVPAQENKTYQ